jgi:NADH dehydrogenase FAD-containing subunit
MGHRIVVLGGGTGGTLAANRLRRLFSPGAATVAVVDQDDEHVYQPGLLFVLKGVFSRSCGAALVFDQPIRRHPTCSGLVNQYRQAA